MATAETSKELLDLLTSLGIDPGKFYRVIIDIRAEEPMVTVYCTGVATKQIFSVVPPEIKEAKIING